MSFWLARLATQGVLPLSLGLGLLAAGLTAQAIGRRRLAGTLLTAGFAWLWLCSLPVTADFLQERLEGLHPPVSVTDVVPAEAILVLGGGIAPALPPRPTAELGEAADRVLLAARLFRAGKAPLVVAAGGVVPTAAAKRPEADATAELLAEWGVPDSAISRERASRNPFENCRFARALLEKRGASDVLLVTSALHMPRALATCRKAGIHARLVSTDVQSVESGQSPLDWLPSAVALEGTSRAVRELLAYAVYRGRGRLGADPAP